jgi:hypothetical protein
MTNWFATPEIFNDSCKVMNDFNETVACEKWIFDRTYYEDTRTTEVKSTIRLIKNISF